MRVVLCARLGNPSMLVVPGSVTCALVLSVLVSSLSIRDVHAATSPRSEWTTSSVRDSSSSPPARSLRSTRFVGSGETMPPESPPCLEWSTATAGEYAYHFSVPVVHDPSRHRAMRFGGVPWGGGPLTNDVWVEDLDSATGWVRLEVAGMPPLPRIRHVAIYDPVRDRLIVSGGYIGPCPAEEDEDEEPCYADDVWALSLTGTPTWQQITTTGPTPGDRSFASAIHDPVRDRMIVVGGETNDYADGGAWALSLANDTWTQLPDGPHWWRAEGFYDPTQDRMVVLKGDEPGSVWTLDLATPQWTLTLATGSLPVGGERSAIVYDPMRDRALLFGGVTPGIFHDTLWELDLTGAPTWSLIAQDNPPPPRWNVTGFYDAVVDQMVIFGGSSANAYGDTWLLPLDAPPAWTRLFPLPAVPTPRSEMSAVWDAPRQRLVVFGGQGTEGDAMNDLYALDVSGAPTWARLEPQGPLPQGRVSMGAVVDASDRMIVFGGRTRGARPNDYGVVNDVWALALDGPPVWTQLTPTGTPPVARTAFCVVYDTPRNRMIVFAGNDSTGVNLNDTWALDLDEGGSWQQLAPTGTPPAPMVAATAVHDPIRDRMLVIGGYRGSEGGLITVWSLSLSGAGAWTQLAPQGPSPPPMYLLSALYDPIRDRVLVYGDEDLSGHVYALSLDGTPAWSRASIVGTPPDARQGHVAAFDPGTDRMVVFGGVDFEEFVYRNDALVLAGADAAASLTTAAAPLASGTVSSSPDLVCFGVGAMVTITATPAPDWTFVGWSGDASGTTNPLTVSMAASRHVVANFSPVVGVEPARLHVAGIDAVAPNPTLGRTSVRYALAQRGHVRLRVVDVAGRVVATLLDADRDAGAHVVEWDARSARLRGGIYFVRLTTADRTFVERMVFVE